MNDVPNLPPLEDILKAYKDTDSAEQKPQMPVQPQLPPQQPIHPLQPANYNSENGNPAARLLAWVLLAGMGLCMAYSGCQSSMRNAQSYNAGHGSSDSTIYGTTQEQPSRPGEYRFSKPGEYRKVINGN